MRILVLCHRPVYPPDNGAKLRIVHLARQMAREHKIAFLCPGAQPGEIQALRSLLGPGAETAPIAWPSPRGWRSAAAFLSLLPRDIVRATEEDAAARVVNDWIRKWKPDLLWATDPIIGEYLHNYQDIPQVVDIAAEYVLYIRRALLIAPAAVRPLWMLRAAKWEWYMRRLSQWVTLWTVPSTVDAESLRALSHGNARTVVIPNGVDLDATPYHFDPEAPPDIAFCSALGYEPNRDALHHFILEGWPHIQAHSPASRLLVTGGNKHAPDTARRTPGVVLTGYLPEVRSLLTACRASVVPLRLGVGTRFKILEALAVGTPVVSTCAGAEGLAVTDGRDILLADKPSDFARKVIDVLESQSLRQNQSAAGRRLVEELYSWDHIGTTLGGVLSDLAGPTPAQPPSVPMQVTPSSHIPTGKTV